MREADEKEEREFRLLLEMEENKTKQREYATEQVRQVKVSTVTVQFFSDCYWIWITTVIWCLLISQVS